MLHVTLLNVRYCIMYNSTYHCFLGLILKQLIANYMIHQFQFNKDFVLNEMLN